MPHELAEVVQAALPAAPEVEHVVLSGDATLAVPPSVSSSSWDAFLDAGRAATALRDPAATDEDSWALWLYTSGTTGLPKAAMHRHANIRHVAETYGAQVLGIRPDDVTFSIAKLFFAYGIGNSLFFPLSVGATALLDPRRPSPQMAAERLAADRPTLFFAVPTFYGALLASDLPDDTFASVRLAASAGEPLPGPLLRRFKDRFGVDIIDGIGSTEALHIFLSNRSDDIRPGTTGTAVPGYDVVVRGEDGRETAPGEPGALHVRGESIALGYWHRTDATRQVFQGEWLVTGDTYVRDEQGYYTCLGRNSDMLKAGRHLGLPGRGGEPPDRAPTRARGRRRRDGRRARDRQAGRRRRRGRGDRGGAGRLVPRRDGALQGTPPGAVRGRPAEDRDRQAPTLQGPLGPRRGRQRHHDHRPRGLRATSREQEGTPCRT